MTSQARRKKVAWGITGAGHYLTESFDLFVQFKDTFGVEVSITTFVSRAAEEVARVYGLFHYLQTISPGDYMEEVILESAQGWSYPKTGRFSRGNYDALFISPTTSNTVAKIAYGIADSLITNAVAHAIKGGIPVFLVPVDIEGRIESPVPYFINRDICVGCERCQEACPHDAINEQIDYLKCTGCGLCKDICDYNAIQGGQVMLVVRDIDKQNVKRLRKMERITVLDDPSQLERALRNVLTEEAG
ncbi:MAG: dihydromethanopterin reductase (acceptor) [Euryarchaeota archaeon]|nr:dihydromethanopterin reductase (acceptor) [Euryarchaeota archaeon]